MYKIETSESYYSYPVLNTQYLLVTSLPLFSSMKFHVFCPSFLKQNNLMLWIYHFKWLPLGVRISYNNHLIINTHFHFRQGWKKMFSLYFSLEFVVLVNLSLATKGNRNGSIIQVKTQDIV